MNTCKNLPNLLLSVTVIAAATCTLLLLEAGVTAGPRAMPRGASAVREATPVPQSRRRRLPDQPTPVEEQRAQRAGATDAARAVPSQLDTTSLLEKIGSGAAAGAPDPEQLATLGTQLLRRLRESPDAVKALMGRLRASSCGHAEASLLLSLLSATASEEAQAAFLEYLQSPATPTVRREMAVIYVAQAPEPGEAFDETLARISLEPGRLGDNGLLGLASLGQQLKDRAPERHERIARRVIEELDRAEQLPDLRTALQAVGNLGAERIPEAVYGSLVHEDPMVRMAATDALQRVQDPEATVALRRVALEDPEPMVRLAALETLIQRVKEEPAADAGAHGELVELLARVARDDRDEHLRGWAADQAESL